MKPLEILSCLPGWSGASSEALLASPAWTMPCRLGEESCTMRIDAVRPAETLALSIMLENENHVLCIADSPGFPELHAIWETRGEVPEPILLAIVEKDCGKFFQLLENATRMQLKVVGLADSPADAGQTAFARICNTDGETVISFTLDLTPSVISVLGHLRNLDAAHPSIREESIPAVVEYATFTIPAADLASLAQGDALLLPEIDTLRPRLVVAGRLVVSENGVAPWRDDGMLRVCAADDSVVAAGDVLDAANGQPSKATPATPPDNTPLRLVRSGQTIATGRLGRLGSQFAFLL